MSSRDKSPVRGGGIGFLGLLTILFIGLKLTGYITWGWFWVLLPALFPFLIIGFIFGTFIILSLIALILEIFRKRD